MLEDSGCKFKLNFDGDVNLNVKNSEKRNFIIFKKL